MRHLPIHLLPFFIFRSSRRNEQWTQVPLLAKLLKLLINEMNNIIEEANDEVPHHPENAGEIVERHGIPVHVPQCRLEAPQSSMKLSGIYWPGPLMRGRVKADHTHLPVSDQI